MNTRFDFVMKIIFVLFCKINLHTIWHFLSLFNSCNTGQNFSNMQYRKFYVRVILATRRIKVITERSKVYQGSFNQCWSLISLFFPIARRCEKFMLSRFFFSFLSITWLQAIKLCFVSLAVIGWNKIFTALRLEI